MKELEDLELDGVSGGANGRYFPYTIVRGDTLSGIAKRFGVELYLLQRLNNIQNADVIKEGRKLLIPRKN